MSAYDDSWDVYDKCIEMGLDPDRISHRDRARAQMSREFNERYERENPMTPERAAAQERKAKKDAELMNLFKSRYGALEDEE